MKLANRQQKKKFSTKLFRIFVLISLIPLLIISATSIYIVIKTRQKNIAELQNLAVSNAYEKVTKYLNQKMEGLNLIVSGKSSTNETAPSSLTATNPNHLIFLLKKRWQKENELGNLETISFLGLDNEIILQINKNNNIIVKNYFANTIPIIHDQVTISNNIYDPNIAKLNLDASRPSGLVKFDTSSGHPEAWLAAPLLNQNDFKIGQIVTQINLNNIIKKIKAPLTVEKDIPDLSDLPYDNSISLVKESRRRYGDWLADQGINIISASFLSKTGQRIIRLDEKQIITLKIYSSEEVRTLDASIRIDNGQLLSDIDSADPTFNTILSGKNPYKIELFTAVTSADAEPAVYIKYSNPLLNNQGKIIGVNEVILSLNTINNSQSPAKLGDANKKISEIDPNNLIYLLKSVKQVSGADNSIREIKFINETGDVLAAIDENGLITIKKDYWQETLPAAVILPAYLGQVRLVDFIDQNYTDRTEYKTAIYGRNYFGPLQIVEKKAIMRLASQFQNNDNEIIGVVAADVYLDPLKNIIDEIKIGNTGYLYLLDNSGYVVASTNGKFAKTGQNLKDIVLVNNVLNGQVYDGLNRFTAYTNQLNQKVIFSGSPMNKIGSAEHVNWFIFSEWPQDDAFSVIKYILQISLLFAFGTFIIIIILGSIFSQQIVRPIKSLVLAAQEIAKGNLEYKINMRTNDEFDILSDRFNDMVKILQENRKLRDEFVFISAHELRTPVTAIKGYLSLILDKTFGEVPPAIKENLEIVNNSNQRLVQLVNDLLEIARSEAGKMKITLAPTPIGENVMTIVNELKTLADKKNIKMNYDEPELSKTIVQADTYKLKEVLTNLIGNAIKYTLTNGDINIKHEIKDGMLNVHVEDHGMGMSKENMDKLFTKFYRVQTKDTQQIEGTGLGLFICKEIVERMNGKIWVTSEVGKGSTFSFSLQIADEKTAPNTEGNNPAAPNATAT